MTLRLNGSTSGYTEIDAPAVGGNNLLTLPTGNGTADQALVTNGSGALSWSDRGRMTLATAQNSTSGTSIDFTGIPSWVKRVTVMFNGVSTNGTNSIQVQLGTSAGMDIASGYISSANSLTYSTTGLLVTSGSAAANNYQGIMTIANLSGNTWVSSCVTSRNDANTFWCAGSKTLSGTLDRLRITTYAVSGTGTDTFDAGSINIMYEG